MTWSEMARAKPIKVETSVETLVRWSSVKAFVGVGWSPLEDEDEVEIGTAVDWTLLSPPLSTPSSSSSSSWLFPTVPPFGTDCLRYNPKQTDRSSISRTISSGSGLAQYISSEAKASFSVGIGMSDGSVEMKKLPLLSPSRVHVLILEDKLVLVSVFVLALDVGPFAALPLVDSCFCDGSDMGTVVLVPVRKTIVQ